MKDSTIILHSLGLGILGGSIFMQILLFMNILQYGKVISVEPNTTILLVEIVFAIFGAVYLAYLYLDLARRVKN